MIGDLTLSACYKVVRSFHVAVGRNSESREAVVWGASKRVGGVLFKRSLHVHLMVAHWAFIVGRVHSEVAPRTPQLLCMVDLHLANH